MKITQSRRAQTVLLSICTAWLLTLSAAYLWPASWWMEVRSVFVGDTRAGLPVVMHVDRRINRDFVGRWSVTVRELQGTENMLACVASAAGDYKRGAKLPKTLTLSWWTNGKCEALPVGVYVVTTIWEVENGPLPGKIIHAQSNPFKVSP